MAITKRSATLDLDVTATASITTPAVAVVGDVVIVIYGNNYYTLANMGTPSATGSPTMNLISGTTVDNGTNDAHLKAYWYVANTAGAQTISVTESGAADEEKVFAVLILGGADTTTAIDAAASGGGQSLTHTAPSVTTSRNDSFRIAFTNTGTGSTVAAYGTPSPFTEEGEIRDGFLSAVLATHQSTTTGAQGACDFDASPGSIPYAAVQIAVLAASGAASVPVIRGEVPPAPFGTPWRGPRAEPFQLLGDASTVSTANVSLNDTGAGTDAVTVTATAALADTGAGADAVTVAATATLADTGTGTDAITVTVAASLADTGAGTDNVSVAATIALTDVGSGADAITTSAAVPLADTGAGTDSVTVTVTTTISDTGAGADALSLSTGTDQYQAWPGVAWMFLAPNAASVQMGGSRVASGDQVIGLPDTGTGADALTASATVPLADTGAGTDALTVTVAVALADTSSGADDLTVSATVVLDDPAAGADGITVQVAGQPDPYQSWPQTGGWWLRRPNAAASFQLDGSTEFGDRSISLSDTGSATDAVTVAVAVTLTDTAVGTDSVSSSASAALTDTAAGADSLAVVASVSLTDTAAGADAISVSGSSSPSLPDTAAGVDTVTVAATVALTDTSTALDAMTVARAAFLADTATAVDGLTVVVAVTLTDAGTAVDVFVGPVFDRTITRGRAVLGNPARRAGRGTW